MAVRGDRGEKAAGLRILVLLHERQRRHFARASEPGVAGLGHRLQTRDDLFRLDRVELQRRQADGGDIAEGLGNILVAGELAILGDGGGPVVLLESHCGIRQHCGRADDIAVRSLELRDALRHGLGPAGGKVGQ